MRFALLDILVMFLLACFAVCSKSLRPVDLRPPPAANSTRLIDQEIDPEDVISVNTTEVLLPVTVRNPPVVLVKNLNVERLSRL